MQDSDALRVSAAQAPRLQAHATRRTEVHVILKAIARKATRETSAHDPLHMFSTARRRTQPPAHLVSDDLPRVVLAVVDAHVAVHHDAE